MLKLFPTSIFFFALDFGYFPLCDIKSTDRVQCDSHSLVLHYFHSKNEKNFETKQRNTFLINLQYKKTRSETKR